MDIQKFIEQRPLLYHLTFKENAANILQTGQLISTNEIIRLSGNPAYEATRRQKREVHQEIIVGTQRFFLRDQHPISPKNLAKCLTDGWGISDFLNHLNDRVFMWPTVARLWQHFKRYQQEKPIIFRFSTADIIAANPNVNFCRLNSGATRSNAAYDGAPPERGPNSFLTAQAFDWSYRVVAEVTFEQKCKITGPVAKGKNPNGPFSQVGIF